MLRSGRWALLVGTAVCVGLAAPEAATVASANSILFKQRQADTSCHGRALQDLRHLSKAGAMVFDQVNDKNLFWTFLECDNVVLGLSTAVHESVHGLTEQLDGYPLIRGGVARRPHHTESFVAPRVIRARFDGSNAYVQSYLTVGQASSNESFMFLLDELNAYSHDLHSAVRLRTLRGGTQQVDHRDGLASLMRFLMHYVDEAKANHPKTWSGLNEPRVSSVVRTLWTQAETSLKGACGIPNWGHKDRDYVTEMCNPTQSAALSQVLGRRVACLKECLKGAPRDDGETETLVVAEAEQDSSQRTYVMAANSNASRTLDPTLTDAAPQPVVGLRRPPRIQAAALPAEAAPARRRPDGRTAQFSLPVGWPYLIRGPAPAPKVAPPVPAAADPDAARDDEDQGRPVATRRPPPVLASAEPPPRLRRAPVLVRSADWQDQLWQSSRSR